MEKALLHFLGGRRKTDVSALELRLIPAAELLQAQREAETLADGDTAALGLCLNACILARAAFGKNGKRAFADGAEGFAARACGADRPLGGTVSGAVRGGKSAVQRRKPQKARQALENGAV